MHLNHIDVSHSDDLGIGSVWVWVSDRRNMSKEKNKMKEGARVGDLVWV